MQYYKELDVDNYDNIVDKTLKFVKEKTNLIAVPPPGPYVKTSFNEYVEHVPEIKTAFIKYERLIPTSVAFFVVWGESSIHKDAGHLAARINFPILNYKGAITNFYKNAVFEEHKHSVTGVRSYSVSNIDYELVDSIETKKATLIRVHEAHKVVLSKNFPVPRITMTVGFNKDPVFLFDN